MKNVVGFLVINFKIRINLKVIGKKEYIKIITTN